MSSALQAWEDRPVGLKVKTINLFQAFLQVISTINLTRSRSDREIIFALACENTSLAFLV